MRSLELQVKDIVESELKKPEMWSISASTGGLVHSALGIKLSSFMGRCYIEGLETDIAIHQELLKDVVEYISNIEKEKKMQSIIDTYNNQEKL